MAFDLSRVPVFNSAPFRATPLYGDDAAAAAALSPALVPNVDERAYIAGLIIGGLGATAAARIICNIANLSNGNMPFYVSVPVGATVTLPRVEFTFTVPMPALNLGQNIVVNVPSFGAGNTDAWAVCWGFSLAD